MNFDLALTKDHSERHRTDSLKWDERVLDASCFRLLSKACGSGHPRSKGSVCNLVCPVPRIADLLAQGGRLAVWHDMYCYCCWQEDPKKQQQTVLDVSDERQRTVVHTENAMSEVKEEEDMPHTFMVKFRRKGPLSIDKTDIHNVVINHVAGSLLDWNQSQASEHQIRRYDRIVQVNGKKISGVDVDLHIEDKSRADVLLTLQRPVKRKLTLHRPGKLGVDLQYRKSSAKPWLTNITDGLVLQWNQENPSQMVTAHDRLVAVNSREELDGVIEEVRGPKSTRKPSYLGTGHFALWHWVALTAGAAQRIRVLAQKDWAKISKGLAEMFGEF
eukprot:s2018_g10.t1